VREGGRESSGVAEKVSKTGFLENRKRRRWGRG